MKVSPELSPKKIAVIAPNKPFFGALIVTIPFFRALRELFPEAELDIFSPRKEFAMIQELGLADKIIEYDIKGGSSGFFTTLSLLREGSYHALIVMRRESMRDRLLGFFSGIPLRLGFMKKRCPFIFHESIPYDKYIYRGENYLNLIWLLGENAPLRFFRPYGESTKKRDSIWLLPCGSDEEKLWPPENYAKLARLIRNRLDLRVKFILGPGEKSSFFEEEFKGDEKVEFLKNLPLKELLLEASSSAASVGNDCGPGHIAQTMGVKSIVLFAAEKNVDEWVNIAGGSKSIVSSGPIEMIDLEEVFTDLEEILKRPGSDRKI
ncbi:MAG: glycosyltransferase family 9 protein [Elusimicrobia bacterium]|nr:glycosyltransferase family 9 protein [Elusimicrobiota bacterium]